MRRREFIRLLGGAAVAFPHRGAHAGVNPADVHASREPYDHLHIDICIYCMIYLASGLTPPEHQAEWSLTAIAERWG
jgi:hypothetical protein